MRVALILILLLVEKPKTYGLHVVYLTQKIIYTYFAGTKVNAIIKLIYTKIAAIQCEVLVTQNSE